MEATWATALPAISVSLFGPGKVWTNEPAALLIFMPWHHSRRVRVVVGFLGALASWASVSLLYGT